MTWLVVWFRSGELHHATVCRSLRTTRRIANSYNEYAEMYNRASGTPKDNIVCILPDYDLVKFIGADHVHLGLPQHTPPEKLKVMRRLREFKNMPVRGSIQ